MKKITSILLFATALTSCSTPYQEYGSNYLSSGGYGEYQIAEDTYSVSFEGNTHTNRSQVYSFAMRRAAELTVSKGFPFFEVVSEKLQTKEEKELMGDKTNQYYVVTLYIKMHYERPSAEAYEAAKFF